MKVLPYLPLAGAAVLAFLAAGADDPARQEALTGWAAALVGATMALLGVRAVVRGKILVRSTVAEREENPTHLLGPRDPLPLRDRGAVLRRGVVVPGLIP